MKADYQKLFFEIVRALTFEDLRLKPRERLLVLILAIESFGQAQDHGVLNVAAWRIRLKSWRINELWHMLSDFEKCAWITVDIVEGTYRLAPDRLPGWHDVVKRQLHEGQFRLPTPDDLNKIFAKISQDAACENFAVRGAPLISPMARGPDVVGFSGLSELQRHLSGLSGDGGLGHARALKVFKNHKGSKPLEDLMGLKGRLLEIESGPEQKAYEAMRDVLGFEVMEGGDLDANDQPRLGDGGKWRNRWRTNRARVHRVFAALVEQIGSPNPPKSRGARIEFFWQEGQSEASQSSIEKR